MTLQSWGQVGPLGEVLQAQMRQLGIRVETELLSWPGQIEVGTSGAAHMTVMGGSGFFADDSLRGFFHSDNIDDGFSWSRVRDPELDALLEAGARALNATERKQIYDQVQVMIMDQALILPVYDYVLMTGINTRVKDITWSRTGLVPHLNDVYIDG
jgi:peptide/nickel transport system substrate-binding protein